jgi:hypothetical protein
LLAVSLATAINTHYYGVLLYPAFIAAEAARCWLRREMQYFAFGALAASLAGVATVFPFARAASSYARGFWTPLGLQALNLGYGQLFGLSSFILLVLAALLCAGTAERESDRLHRTSQYFASDMFLGVCLLGILPVCYLLAITVTKAFFFRYVIVATGGLAILVPLMLVCYAYRRVSVWVLLGTTALLGSTNIIWHARANSWPTGSLDSMRAKVTFVLNAARDPRYPVVWANPLECFAVTHHFAALTRGRVYCLSGPPEASTYDRAAKGLAPWTDLPIRDKDLFLREHREFWLVDVAEQSYGDARCQPVATDQTLRLSKCSSKAEQQ